MDKKVLKNIISKATGRTKADLILKNVQIVDVFNARIIKSNVAISEGRFLGYADDYESDNIIDGKNKFVVPGLIDPHIHIESANVSPAVFGSLVIPHGTTTIFADPHELVNVAGMRGLEYMIVSAKNTILDIKYMMPSCVPAASPKLETSGAIIKAPEIQEAYDRNMAYGLAEFMNYDGVINADDDVLDELITTINSGKMIDGHSPSLMGKDLNAYIAAGVHDDHECVRVEEMLERISKGMYVYLRYGTVSKNMPELLKGVTDRNSRFCCLCGDDIQSVTLKETGHLDESIRVAVKEGIDPITAIQMATINTAQCTGLSDRGAIAPGLKADFLLVDDLEDFQVDQTYIDGKLVGQQGRYQLEVDDNLEEFNDLLNTVHLEKITKDQLKLNIKGDKVHVVKLQNISRTQDLITTVNHDENGDFVRDEHQDIVKTAVVERHHLTGNVGVGLLSGFEIKTGAIATSIGHDSHNLVVIGTNDEEMIAAIEALKQMQGGGVAIKDGEVIASISFRIGGLMSNEPIDKLISDQKEFNRICHEELGVKKTFDPIMKMGAIPLDVIPNLRITDKGIVDVTKFEIIEINA